MKHAGHGYHKTTIVHHGDNSHTVTHHVHPDHAHEMKDKEYATGDHDSMIDGIMDHTSQPNPGEGENMEGEKMEEAIHPGIHAQVAKAQGM